jgi:steroid 5-alpha reductase family enzyme
MHPVLVVLLASALAMAGVFLVQLRTRNAGYVDVAWSYLMAGAAAYYAATGAGAPLPRILVALLAGLWGLRLGTYLLLRVSREPEDGRYRHLREHWNGSQPKFFAFFMFQAALTAILSLPYYVVAQNPVGAWTPWTILGVAVFVVAVALESVADRQLAGFRHDPANRGKVCDIGLWRFSRHPNYFFEWLHWFAYVALAIGAPLWWLALLGPVLMGLSLGFVTGIPFVEAQSLRSRGDAYREYQRRTSVFVPWLPGRDGK